MANRKSYERKEKTNSKRNYAGNSGRNDKRSNLRSRNKNNDTDCDARLGDNPNHISWYNRYNQLTKDAGSVSFFNPAGAPFKTFGVEPSVPGIMSIEFAPTVGVSKDSTSPLNVAARKLYERINYKNSRNFSYDAADLMNYFIAYDSVIALHAFMRRVYGILNTFSNVNRYVPYAFLTAMGLDAESFRRSMPQFRYEINRMAQDMSNLSMPAGSTYTARHVWLNSNVFADSPEPKAQFYVPYLSSYFQYFENVKYSEDGEDKGGACVLRPLKPVHIAAVTYENLVSYARGLVESLILSQDINNMSTDVLKACEGRIWTWDTMPEDFAVTPSYSEEVLQQIHNTVAFGNVVYPDYSLEIDDAGVTAVLDTEYGVVGQHMIIDGGRGTLTYKQKVQSGVSSSGLPHLYVNPFQDGVLVDTNIENPSAEDLMVMTRNIVIVDGLPQDYGTFDVLYAGSEIPLMFHIYHMGSAGALEERVLTSFSAIEAERTEMDFNSDSIAKLSSILYGLTKFDWAPHTYVGYSIGADTRTEACHVGDLYNYAKVDIDVIRKLHEVALLSMFALDA